MAQIIKNDDCLSVLQSIPDEYFDCLCTDPPYRTRCSKAKLTERGTSTDRLRNRWVKKNLDEDSKILAETGQFIGQIPPFEAWLPEVYRVLKPNTHAYIMLKACHLKEFQTKAEKVGFKFQNLLVWAKQNATPNKFYMQKGEFILMLRKGKERYINDMGVENIFFVRNPVGKKFHPTEKPVELMRKMIEQSTNIGDKVLDPFVGAGATLCACEEIHRLGTGIEIEKRFCEVAYKRLENVKLDYIQGGLLDDKISD